MTVESTSKLYLKCIPHHEWTYEHAWVHYVTIYCRIKALIATTGISPCIGFTLGLCFQKIKAPLNEDQVDQLLEALDSSYDDAVNLQ